MNHQTISSYIQIRNAIGTGSALKWGLIRLRRRLRVAGPESCRMRPRQVRHPLRARLHNSSDLGVFYQIFVQQEYSSLRSLEDVSLVLDLGANVGYSSASFLSCFPNSRVVAVELDGVGSGTGRTWINGSIAALDQACRGRRHRPGSRPGP